MYANTINDAEDKVGFDFCSIPIVERVGEFFIGCHARIGERPQKGDQRRLLPCGQVQTARAGGCPGGLRRGGDKLGLSTTPEL